MTTVSELLTKFALSETAIPEDTLHMMRLSLLDWASCGIAGASEPVSQIIRDMVLREGGAGQATLIGGGAAPARAAALVNGTISHALDYDDTHFAHIGHPSVAVIPAALAVAEASGSDGAEFLAAATRGIEASIRIGEWLGRAHYQIGFHQTGTAGAFGATVAAGRLLGLTKTQMSQALGVVSTKAAALKSQFGTMGKPYNAGLAASAGVEAAFLAQAGFISAPEALDGPQGFGPTHHGEANLQAFDDLGTAWCLDTISHKFHACCHGTHAMIEALLTLRDAVSPGSVTAVEVVNHPRWLSVCDIASPVTGLEAKFSYRLIAAMVLSRIDTSALSSFFEATAQDPGLIGLRDRVRVAADDTLTEMQARVTVTTNDGSRTVEFDLDAPMPLGIRADKLRGKSIALVGETRAKSFQTALFLSKTPNLQALFSGLAA